MDQVLERYGLAIDDPRVQIRELLCTRAAGAAALREVWQGAKHPTAVITFSDLIAFGVVDAVGELDIDVTGSCP